MVVCSEMKVGDVYYCTSCHLEIKVLKSCACKTDGNVEERCSVPLQCCGKPLTKK
ncbi:hypothetical protein SAMN05660830_02826 [Halodesulfovibrio aestuarii]|uniref:Uncharacterized protein n=1 Tax=Halodesulfovibrio aestuarii TaxID=126333 RepID=A0A8G2CBN7_9BACT|nr:hypothetical protein SAMN05660830_02826 [Halodesulfovibrio aestuarii]